MSIPPASGSQVSTGIDSIMVEDRVFPPTPAMSRDAHIKSMEEYRRLYKQSIEDPEAFWNGVAAELHWTKKWTKVLDWKPPYAKWFVGGKTKPLPTASIARSPSAAATRPPSSGKASPSGRTLAPARSAASPTASSREQVCRFANGLRKLGVKQGRPRHHLHADGPRGRRRHARLRPHRRAALRHLRRLLQPGDRSIAWRMPRATIVITADGGYRRGQIVPLKANVDEALHQDLPRQEGHRPQARRQRQSPWRPAAMSGGTM